MGLLSAGTFCPITRTEDSALMEFTNSSVISTTKKIKQRMGGEDKPRKREKWLSRVRLFATPWTVAYQASMSVGFSRQEYWSGLL